MTDLQQAYCTHPHARRTFTCLKPTADSLLPVAWCIVCQQHVYREDGVYTRLRARRVAPPGALSLCPIRPEGRLSVADYGALSITTLPERARGDHTDLRDAAEALLAQLRSYSHE